MAKWLAEKKFDNFGYDAEWFRESMQNGRVEIKCNIRDCDGDFTEWTAQFNGKIIGSGVYYGSKHYDTVKDALNRWIASGDLKHLPVQSAQDRATLRARTLVG